MQSLTNIIFPTILIFLLLTQTASSKEVVPLQNKLQFSKPSETLQGGFSFFDFGFHPADGYEIIYFADGVKQAIDSSRPYSFKLKNPLQKSSLEPVEHKFLIKDLKSGEILEKSYTYGVFDTKKETFVPEYKGVDYGKIRVSSIKHRGVFTNDNLPPAIGSLIQFSRDSVSYFEVKAVDDKGIETVELYVDGKKFSEAKEKESPYTLKLPSDDKSHSYKVIITDTSGNTTQRTSNKKAWGGWE